VKYDITSTSLLFGSVILVEVGLDALENGTILSFSSIFVVSFSKFKSLATEFLPISFNLASSTQC